MEIIPAPPRIKGALRDVVARLTSVAPDTLTQKPERVSVKIAGCEQLPPHIDTNRVGTLQIVVATASAPHLAQSASRSRLVVRDE